MKALVFAAGRGERMRPLTDTVPKPLLPVRGKPLIEWHLERLAAAGVTDVVVNTSWLADRFPAVLGDGRRWGLRLHWSHEGAEPLETGGGMLRALPLLGGGPFLVISADVWCDADLAALPASPPGLAWLLLVDNPPHHPEGDFELAADGRVGPAPATGGASLTYAGIGVFRPALLDGWREAVGEAPGASDEPPRFRLAPVLRAAMAQGRVHGRRHDGVWADVGTPERLAALDAGAG